MHVTELTPRTLSTVDASADRDGARAWVAQRYSRPSAGLVRLNMVTSLTGSAAGADGTSESLTGGVDRLVLGVIRAAADAVIVGAQTVRAEEYLLPRTAALVILTRTGDLEGIRLPEPTERRTPLLVVCPADSADVVRATASAHHPEIVPLPGPDLSPDQVLAALRARGLQSLVCEGGPSLASQFARADAIDEYCVTVAPAISPRSSPFVDIAGPLDTEVAGHLVDEAGFSYLRLRRSR